MLFLSELFAALIQPPPLGDAKKSVFKTGNPFPPRDVSGSSLFGSQNWLIVYLHPSFLIFLRPLLKRAKITFSCCCV